MKIQVSLALSFLLSTAISAEVLIPRALIVRPRQNNCFAGEKECGAGCISLTETCCPDGSGGCPASEYCSLQSNNEYGCCPNGETCEGPGGAITDTRYITDTNTITLTTSYTATTPAPVPATTTTAMYTPSTSGPVASYTPGSVNMGNNAYGHSSAVMVGCSAAVAVWSFVARLW